MEHAVCLAETILSTDGLPPGSGPCLFLPGPFFFSDNDNLGLKGEEGSIPLLLAVSRHPTMSASDSKRMSGLRHKPPTNSGTLLAVAGSVDGEARITSPAGALLLCREAPCLRSKSQALIVPPCVTNPLVLYARRSS